MAGVRARLGVQSLFTNADTPHPTLPSRGRAIEGECRDMVSLIGKGAVGAGKIELATPPRVNTVLYTLSYAPTLAGEGRHYGHVFLFQRGLKLTNP